MAEIRRKIEETHQYQDEMRSHLEYGGVSDQFCFLLYFFSFE